jgi:hypothetical protein
LSDQDYPGFSSAVNFVSLIYEIALVPQTLRDAMFRDILHPGPCPPLSAITAALEAASIPESSQLAARLQFDWHIRSHPRRDSGPCAESCEETARFEASKPREVTSAHAAQLRQWLAEWLAIGRDTEPADRPCAETAIAGLYREMGREPPCFRWALSPADAGVILRSQPRGPEHGIGQFLGHDFMGAVAADAIEQAFWSFLATNVRGTLRETLLAASHELGRSLEDLGRVTRDAAADQAGTLGWGPRGQHDAHWLAVHTFARDVAGVWYPRMWSRRLDGWAKAARACSLWWPFERLCVISERPAGHRWDEAGRLHDASSPAVLFRDGTGAHAWHGAWVPGNWITAPDTVDPHEVLNLSYAERRAAGIAILGWARMVAGLAPRTIDRHPDPMIGELLEVDIPRAGRARFLKVRCATGRDFLLCVPRELPTALAANAWTYGLTPDEYNLEARA